MGIENKPYSTLLTEIRLKTRQRYVQLAEVRLKEKQDHCEGLYKLPGGCQLTKFRFRGRPSIPDGIGVIASLILAEWIVFTQDPFHFNDVKELMDLTKFGSGLLAFGT